MKTTRLSKSQRGFTLIEASVVLTIVAILATTAAPAMQGLVDACRLDGVASQLASDIQFVRTEAVARNTPLRMSFHGSSDGSCYVIHSGADCDCAGQCSSGAATIRRVPITAADRVGLQSNTASLLFDPLHGTSSPTGTLRVTGRDGRAIQHVVNLMGRVRSCSPQAAVPGYRAC